MQTMQHSDEQTFEGIVGKISEAPSFGQIEEQAYRIAKAKGFTEEKFDAILKNMVSAEQRKNYVARTKDGGTQWKYFLCQNPALMTYQTYMRATKIYRKKPIAISARVGAKWFDEVDVSENESVNSKKDW